MTAMWTRPEPRAPMSLLEWLDADRRTLSWLASKLRISPQAVPAWTRGLAGPRARHLAEIEKLSGGGHLRRYSPSRGTWEILPEPMVANHGYACVKKFRTDEGFFDGRPVITAPPSAVARGPP